MLIVSQDQNKIVNFDNVIDIQITDCDGDYVISAIALVGIEDFYIDLGCYKTEERTKEILQQIIGKYNEYAKIQNGVGSVANVAILPKIYEMPKE